jgi:hypothetical protein
MTNKLDNFKDWFKNHRNNILFHTTDNEKIINSLLIKSSHLRTDPNGDEIFEFLSVTWQEEGLGYGYHYVCSTETSQPTMIYNMTKDQILRDAYLIDKYEDGSDQWVSRALEDFFKTTPTLLKDVCKSNLMKH